MDRELLCLMKIGDYENMLDLLDNGTLFLNRLKSYREIEEPERGDTNECISRSWQPDKVELNLNGTIIKGLIGPIRMDYHEFNPLTYCMYGYNSSHVDGDPEGLLDERCYKFGDTAVVIKDGSQFFDRIVKYCKDNNFSMEGKLVNYVDYDTYHGEMGPFRKYQQLHEHQQEFRFVFNSDIDDEDFAMKIGSIRDIAEIHPVRNINNIIKIRGLVK